jgi:hypothetical protein
MKHRRLTIPAAAGLALGLAHLVTGATPAKAGFIFEIGSASNQINFDKATNVTSFTGSVQGSEVSFASVHSVDVASGNATIKPHTGILTSLTATPESGANFTEFSTRGQLMAAGSVTLTVIDQHNTSFSHTFTGLSANADFSALEVIAVAGSGETIKSVSVTSDGFKELKQEAFGYDPIGTGSVPEPASLVMAALPMSLLALVLIRRRNSR